MADDNTDDSQKTEDATPRKLEDARKRGQIVYSKEVNNWFVIFASTMLIVITGPDVVSGLKADLAVFLSMPHAMPTDPQGLLALCRNLFLSVGKHLALPFLLLMFAAFFSGFIQTGALFSLDPLKPDISKLSIIKGLGRLFSMRSIAELIKGILKIVIISTVGVMVIKPYFFGLEHFVGQDISLAMQDMMAMYLSLMIAIISILTVIAIVDYTYQRHTFMKEMRMSKQEVKDEYKQTEGDPMVRGKLRQLREQKARQRMMQSVPDADVVITNPTHYAVALKYNPQEMQAPILLAKGTDKVAARIKEVANEHKITIVENPPLARSLFDSMEIDQMIPDEHWKAVAEVISYVFKLKGKRV